MKHILIILMMTFCVTGCSDKPFEKDIINYYGRKDKIEVIVESVIVDSTASKEEIKALLQKRLNGYIKAANNTIDTEINFNYDSSIFERTKRLKKNDLKQGVNSQNEIVSHLSRMLEQEPSYHQITAKYKREKNGALYIEKFSVFKYSDSTNLKPL